MGNANGRVQGLPLANQHVCSQVHRGREVELLSVSGRKILWAEQHSEAGSGERNDVMTVVAGKIPAERRRLKTSGIVGTQDKEELHGNDAQIDFKSSAKPAVSMLVSENWSGTQR